MPKKPRSMCHTTEELGDTLTISIPSRKHWFAILVMVLWTSGWIYGVITEVGKVLTGNAEEVAGPMLLIMMISLFGGVCVGSFILFSMLAGKEVIEITSQSISIGYRIFELGYLKEYQTGQIKNLRVFFAWSRDGGRIAFDYAGSRMIKLGFGIGEAEAGQIVAEIQQRFPQYRSQGSDTRSL